MQLSKHHKHNFKRKMIKYHAVGLPVFISSYDCSSFNDIGFPKYYISNTNTQNTININYQLLMRATFSKGEQELREVQVTGTWIQFQFHHS